MSNAERATRTVALDMACRVAPLTGAHSTGHVLSAARQFERYLESGLSQVGANGLERTTEYFADFSVSIESEKLSAEQAASLTARIREALS